MKPNSSATTTKTADGHRWPTAAPGLTLSLMPPLLPWVRLLVLVVVPRGVRRQQALRGVGVGDEAVDPAADEGGADGLGLARSAGHGDGARARA